MMKRVEPIGPKDARIMLVGEAPGADEVALGIPFIGASGDLLSRTMLGVGIKREECYLTNVCKIKPPSNKMERLKELGLTVEQFYPELYTEINNIKPNIIIALGNTALEALTGYTGISNWRGSILEGISEIKGRKIIPTVHPAFCLRVYNQIHLLRFDLKKAAQEAAYPDIRKLERLITISPTFEQALTCLDHLSNTKRICIDIETYRKSGLIRTIGFATSPLISFCIPIIRSIHQLYWNREEEREIWKRVAAILLDPTKEWIGQNTQFETSQLWPYINGQVHWWMDTLRAHAIQYPEFPHDLAFMTSIFTDMPYYKEEGKVSDDGSRDFEQLQIYNCKDVLVTYEIAEKLEKELSE